MPSTAFSLRTALDAVQGGAADCVDVTMPASPRRLLDSVIRRRPRRDSRVETYIGRYRVLDRIAAGGMGVVYVAESPAGDKVALKVLRRQLVTDDEIVERFIDESAAVARIDHPNIVGIVDCGRTEDGAPFIAMELLAGVDLSAALATRDVPLGWALSATIDLAEVLAASHRAGIVHCDLKPCNVFLVGGARFDQAPTIKVLDFGVATFLDRVERRYQDEPRVVGTPTYMSPEQCRCAERIDARTDVYSLGCILYRMLYGKLPFDGEMAEVLLAHLHDEVEFPPIPPLPEGLEQLVREMLAKDPADRPADMATVAERLRAIAATV